MSMELYETDERVITSDSDGNRISHYSTTGTISEKCAMLNGVPHGSYFDYYPNGTLCQQGQFKNGEQDGKWSKWSKKGVLQVVYYKDGVKIGKATGIAAK